MTTVNVVAAAFTTDLSAAPAYEGIATDGATFGAVLDHVLRLSMQVATHANHKPEPSGEVESVHRLFQLAPASPSEEDTAPTLAEIALPIESMSSFLAAFMAICAQAVPTVGATAGEGEGMEGVDGVAFAAMSVSVNDGGASAERPTQLIANAGSDDGDSLSELFATLIEGADDELAMQIADRASEGANLRELVSELVEALAKSESESSRAALEQVRLNQVQQSTESEAARAQASAEARANTQSASSLGALVEALAELATRAQQTGSNAGSIDAQSARTAEMNVALAALDAGNASRAIGALGSAAPVARLVATLTNELAAASGPIVSTEGSSAVEETPLVRETAARVMVALAESAEALKAGSVSGSSQITIQLEPKELGKVTIEVQRTSEGVVAKVMTTTVEAQRAISQNAQQVQDALAGIGVAVTKIELTGPATSGQSTGFEAVLQAIDPSTANHASQQSASFALEASDATTAPVNGNTPIVSETDETVSNEAATSTVQVSGQTVSRGEAQAPVTENVPARGVANLVRDIAEQSGLLAGQGKSEFQIQLRPADLGRLQIRMTLERGEVTIQMRADSAQAKNAIESSLNQLKQSFQEQGIRVDRFEVLVSQGQLSQEHGHPRRSRGWVDEVRTRSNNRGDGEFAGALAAASLDYRA